MTEAQEDLRFKHNFWFVVGLVSFAAILSGYIVDRYESHIDAVLTFWLTSAAMTGINFNVGSSANKTATPKTMPEGGDMGGKTLSLNLEATTTPSNTEPEV